MLAKRFASLVENTRVHIVADAGHQLGQEYLQLVVTRFLNQEAAPMT
jgi:hypothetical protein